MRNWSLIVALVLAIHPLFTPRLEAGDSQPLCGPECLYSALIGLGVDPGTYASFLERVGPPDARGTSLGQLAEIAREFNLSTLEIQTSLQHLQSRRDGPPFSCIAHVDGNHFLLIGDVDKKSVWTIDPPNEGLVAATVFEQRWKGYALLISRSELKTDAELTVASTFPTSWLVLISAVVLVAGGLLFSTRKQLWPQLFHVVGGVR